MSKILYYLLVKTPCHLFPGSSEPLLTSQRWWCVFFPGCGSLACCDWLINVESIELNQQRGSRVIFYSRHEGGQNFKICVGVCVRVYVCCAVGGYKGSGCCSPLSPQVRWSQVKLVYNWFNDHKVPFKPTQSSKTLKTN